MPYNDETRFVNEQFYESIREGHIKTAEGMTGPFLRTRVREDGMLRKVIEPETVTSENFVPQLNTDEAVIIVEKEPASPGAISMAFGENAPPAYYIRGRRFQVVLKRLSSPTLRIDEARLATYQQPIQELLAEMIVKDLTWEEDACFIRMCNTLLGGAAGATNIMSGNVHWQEIPGGISRTTLGDAFKETTKPKSRIPITRMLTNAAFAQEMFKWERSEVGSDETATILHEGWGDRKINNCEVVISIKRELIPDDSIYMFGDSQFIAKFYVWQEPMMYIEKHDVMVNFRVHEIAGMAIGHGDAVFRFDFVTS